MPAFNETLLFWLSAASALLFVAAAIWLVGQRRSPVASLAWILAFAMLPIAGFIVYQLIGPRRLERRKRKRGKAQQSVSNVAPKRDRDAQPPSKARGFARLCEAGVGPRIGQPRLADVDVYFSGRETYAAILEAIAGARHHIHMEYYIWEPDQIGTRLRDALVKKAAEGVEVRIVLDAVGSNDASSKFWKPLTGAGGLVCHFNPLRFRFLKGQLGNFRTHRKIVVVDGHIGFTGGMNVSDVHSDEFSGDKEWRDTHLRLQGPAVRGLQLVFLEAWCDVFGQSPEGDMYFPEQGDAREDDKHLVQVVSSGPDEQVNTIHKLFVAAIASAEERVILSAPYFVPDDALRAALATAVLRGADVQILVPEKNDLKIVGAASRSYYSELLTAGVRIFEYSGAMLHAKCLVVDETISLVGTANADPRSFFLNFEVALVSFEQSMCTTLAESFARDLSRSEEVQKETVAGYGRARIFGQNVCRLLSPML